MEKEILNQYGSDRIGKLESQRTAGQFEAVVDQTRSIMKEILFSPQTPLPGLTTEEMQRFLALLRIHTLSLINLAEEKREVGEAVETARVAKRVIEEGYYQPVVKAAAARLETDVNGAPYDFDAEMLGDLAAYWDLSFRLTGNPLFLENKIKVLEKAIELATEPTAKTLAVFRKAQEDFRRQPGEPSFSALTEAYQAAATASAKIERWERVATIAAQYVVTALDSNHLDEAIDGLEVFLEASVKEPKAEGILSREYRKKAERDERAEHWQKSTPPKVDYSLVLQAS